MEEKMQELIARKEELIKKLDEINNSITKEDLQNATKEELLTFSKLTLEIKNKITAIEAIEEDNK